ncbi:MAG: cyclic nucleotide-binding domain-containing protein [Mariprofundaceae bacterium]
MAVDLKVKANKLLLDGKYKKALGLFLDIHKEQPDDIRMHVKVAELYEKTGDTASAVKHYLMVANTYADQGFVVQAIAINKIIIRLDPSQTQVKERLQELSSDRGDDWAVSTVSHMNKVDSNALSDGKNLNVERTPLLSGLSGDELSDFIDSLQLRGVADKEVIFTEGETGKYLYLIAMGSVRLEAKGAGGKKKAFSSLLEGDFFGEQAFMSRGKHTSTAIAEDECSLLIIERSVFDQWVKKYPNIQSTVEDFYRKRVLERVLAITPVFEGIPDDARLVLADHFRLSSFSRGDEIVREGEAGDVFYLVRSGKVNLFTTDMADKSEQVPLGSMQSGNFFGEVALLTNKPRTATVIADSKVELMELSRANFDKIANYYPSVRKIVEAYQKQRVQSTIKLLLKRQGGAV